MRTLTFGIISMIACLDLKVHGEAKENLLLRPTDVNVATCSSAGNWSKTLGATCEGDIVLKIPIDRDSSPLSPEFFIMSSLKTATRLKRNLFRFFTEYSGVIEKQRRIQSSREGQGARYTATELGVTSMLVGFILLKTAIIMSKVLFGLIVGVVGLGLTKILFSVMWMFGLSPDDSKTRRVMFPRRKSHPVMNKRVYTPPDETERLFILTPDEKSSSNQQKRTDKIDDTKGLITEDNKKQPLIQPVMFPPNPIIVNPLVTNPIPNSIPHPIHPPIPQIQNPISNSMINPFMGNPFSDYTFNSLSNSIASSLQNQNIPMMLPYLNQLLNQKGSMTYDNDRNNRPNFSRPWRRHNRPSIPFTENYSQEDEDYDQPQPYLKRSPVHRPKKKKKGSKNKINGTTSGTTSETTTIIVPIASIKKINFAGPLLEHMNPAPKNKSISILKPSRN